MKKRLAKGRAFWVKLGLLIGIVFFAGVFLFSGVKLMQGNILTASAAMAGDELWEIPSNKSFNCYAYAIGHVATPGNSTGYIYNIGRFSGRQYNSASIEEVVETLKYDLMSDELGYRNVRIFDYCPTIDNKTALICVRLSNSDVHLMKYDSRLDVWLYKDGRDGDIYQYKGVMDNDIPWEIDTYTYDSEIKYVTYDYFAGGSGTEADPFLIENEDQLNNIRNVYTIMFSQYPGYEREINYSFKLSENIECVRDWDPIPYQFTGCFDGNNKSIEYRTQIDSVQLRNKNYYGLFEFLADGAVVENVTLTDCSIMSIPKSSDLSGSGNTCVGLLAGSAYHADTIKGVKIINPKLICDISDAAVGGIVGYAQGTSLESCSVEMADTGAAGQANSDSIMQSDCEAFGGLGGILYSTYVIDCSVEYDQIGTYTAALGGMAGLGDLDCFISGTCNTTLVKPNYVETDQVGPIVGNSKEKGSIAENVDYRLDDDNCIATGTLITLADGTQKAVEDLTGDELLLVWNLQTGQFDTAPILFIDSDPTYTYSVIDLAFSDGTTVQVISEHGFWDYNLNEYVYLDKDAAQYIGHWFNKLTTDAEGNNISIGVQLTDVTITEEVTAAYSPVTYSHLCYYVNGMLSMPGGIEGMFNIFEVDEETMKYDEAQMQADIAQYGLFTYEEFAQIVPLTEDVFEAFNGQYMKVAIGKGLITESRLLGLARRYAEHLS